MATTFLLLSSLLIAQAQPDQPEWVSVKSKDEIFSIEMPVKPTEKTVAQPYDDGTIDVLQYSCTSNDCLYRVECSKVPMRVPDEKLERALAAARDSVAQKVEVLEEEKTSVGGWPAHELMVEAPLRPGAKPSRIAMLILFTDEEFYQVRVFPPPGAEPKDVRKFFDSFKTKKVRPGTKRE